jgi:uncharacterized protein
MQDVLALVPHNLHRVRVEERELLFHVPTTALFALDEAGRAVLDALAGAALSLAQLQQKLSGEHDAAGVAETVLELTALELIRGPGAEPARAARSIQGFPLSTVVLNVNTGCNLACTYCFKEDLAPVASGAKMDLATAQAAIELLLRESPGRDHYNVVFFGGEPLTHFPLLEALVDWAEARIRGAGAHVDFSLTTNATLLTPRIVDWLEAHRVGVAVSLDGPRAVHDRHRVTRGGQGSYRAVEPRVRLLRERYRARPLGARVTLARGTRELEPIFDHLTQELGFDEVGFAPVTAGSVAGFELDERELDGVFAGFEALGERVVAAAREGRKLGFSNLLQLLTDLWSGTSKSLPCGAGYSMLAVDQQGKLNLCHRFTGSALPTFGDVESGVARAELGAFLERRLDLRDRPCETCRIRNLCAGGCYHESWSRYGDPIHPTLHYCDRMRRWIDYGIGAYARIQDARPEWFARHLAPRRAR